MFDLRQLRLFAAVAEFGSFSRAAVALSVSQPVLSRQIKALEREVGAPLLHRNGRGIALTEAGRLLQNHGSAILEQASRAASEIDALASNPTGTIALGMPPSVGVVLTMPLVAQFRARFPRVGMRIVEGFSGHLLEWLVMGKIDVAVLYDAPRTTNLLAEPILRDELYLLGPRRDPGSPAPGPVDAATLARLPMILPPRPHGLRLLLDQALGAAGIEPRVDIEVEAMHSTLRLVESGIGYTILSYSSVHQLVGEGRIDCWPIRNPGIERRLLLATSNQRPMTTATRALTGLIKSEIAALRKAGVWEPASWETPKARAKLPD